jgi:aspartyl-tRNA(Asn)/glutamyl-tRNA(Gln) amidotransferase subunit C
MTITRQEVMAVARLARLQLSEEEIESLGAQLSDILEHMRVLGEVDGGTGVDVAGVPTDWNAPLREDEPGPDPLARDASELAPAWVDGFFTVPRLAALDTDTLDEPSSDEAAAGDTVEPGE